MCATLHPLWPPLPLQEALARLGQPSHPHPRPPLASCPAGGEPAGPGQGFAMLPTGDQAGPGLGGVSPWELVDRACVNSALGWGQATPGPPRLHWACSSATVLGPQTRASLSPSLPCSASSTLPRTTRTNLVPAGPPPPTPMAHRLLPAWVSLSVSTLWSSLCRDRRRASEASVRCFSQHTVGTY